jgi:hypothetical protein
LAIAEREVPAQLSRVPSELNSKEDFLSCIQRERKTPQFLPKVFTNEGPSPEGIR